MFLNQKLPNFSFRVELEQNNFNKKTNNSRAIGKQDFTYQKLYEMEN
jgi:hypothetical protein